MSDILKKKNAVEIMQFQLNIQKLELRLLEMDEEKTKIREAITEQTEKLKVLQTNGN